MTVSDLRRNAAAIICAFACLWTAGCGGDTEPAYDWRNRELAWKYGPTHGTAPLEHLLGTGKKRGKPMAEGWKCVLRDGEKLVIRPFRPAAKHEMFGKAGLVVGLFNRAEDQITTLRTPAITKDNFTFTLELDEETARAVYDLVLWYGKA